MYKTYPSIHVGVGVRIGGLITVLITGLVTACSSSTVDFKPFFDNIYTLFQPLCLKIGTHIGCNSFMVLFVPKADSVQCSASLRRKTMWQKRVRTHISAAPRRSNVVENPSTNIRTNKIKNNVRTNTSANYLYRF